jgi:hypothetical protein
MTRADVGARRMVALAACTLAAYGLERLLGAHLAAGDPLEAAITGSAVIVLATALPLLGLRLFLFFGAPCWWALLLASAVLAAWTDRKRARRTDRANV